MRLKQIAIAFISLGLLMTGCNTSGNSENVAEKVVTSADYPYYDSFDKLGDTSDIIIKGNIISSDVRELNYNSNIVISNNDVNNPGGKPTKGESLIYTVYKVKISQVYKGKCNVGDILEIAQLGGEIQNKEVISKDKIDFNIKSEDEYVLFLHEINGYPAEIITPYQGCYKYNSNKEEFKSMSKGNPLNLTMDELSMIKEKYKN